MSIGRRNKDHLREHGGVTLVGLTPAPPKSDDPLYFWTHHPTENYAVNLHPFADGEFENPHPSGKHVGTWKGAYTGRPNLIAELAPAIQASVYRLTNGGAVGYEASLRAWWRLFEAFENTKLANGQHPPQIESVANLNELHGAFAYQNGLTKEAFTRLIVIINNTRRLMKLPVLFWQIPVRAHRERKLVSDDQAKEIKIALKQDWERVRKTWARNDSIREEAARRASGQSDHVLDKEGEHLLRNWQHYQRIQHKTGRMIPTGEQLLDGKNSHVQWKHGLEHLLMRSILFPTVEEADIAFYLALLNSGWNPSTLVNLDAESPFLVTHHPKDHGQLVLFSEPQDEDATLQASKARAKGKMQFCTGLVKHASSPPAIVAAFQKRAASLRELLKQQYAEAVENLAQMQNSHADEKTIEAQYLRTQQLRQGYRCVWLYVDNRGKINWLDWRNTNRYTQRGSKNIVSYLSLLLDRLNAKRAAHGLPLIAHVTPSDFRDIYARWVYKQSRGSILAVMLALGHSTVASTVNYLENNLFSAENDAHALRFMTRLIEELRQGRIDLTILAQIVRHGPLTPEMEARLAEYRKLMKSRIGIGCADPRHPPEAVAPNHVAGRLCGTHRCLKDCPNAKFLPESSDGIAMRVEELMAMHERLPRETWLHGGFDKELESGEYLLDTLYPTDVVLSAREKWLKHIASGEHTIPGLGRINQRELEKVV